MSAHRSLRRALLAWALQFHLRQQFGQVGWVGHIPGGWHAWKTSRSEKDPNAMERARRSLRQVAVGQGTAPGCLYLPTFPAVLLRHFLFIGRGSKLGTEAPGFL